MRVLSAAERCEYGEEQDRVAEAEAQARDLLDEQTIGLSAVARSLPNGAGGGCNPSTVWRWCRLGIKGVRLEYVRVGRRIVTSREALRRFFRALAAADEPITPAPRITDPAPTRTEKQRERAMAEAEQVCAELGI